MAKTQLRRRDFIRGVVGAAGASAASILQPDPKLLAAAPLPVPPPYTRSNTDPWFLRNDPAWVSKLSQPQYEIEFEFNVKKVPMRDGVMLAANIWRPKAEGKFPIIYMHTPYDKSNKTFSIQRAKYFVPRGYVVVAIDCRGRYDSDGVPYFF